MCRRLRYVAHCLRRTLTVRRVSGAARARYATACGVTEQPLQ